jgi:hypothetical protein
MPNQVLGQQALILNLTLTLTLTLTRCSASRRSSRVSRSC